MFVERAYFNKIDSAFLRWNILLVISVGLGPRTKTGTKKARLTNPFALETCQLGLYQSTYLKKKKIYVDSKSRRLSMCLALS